MSPKFERPDHLLGLFRKLQVKGNLFVWPQIWTEASLSANIFPQIHFLRHRLLKDQNVLFLFTEIEYDKSQTARFSALWSVNRGPNNNKCRDAPSRQNQTYPFIGSRPSGGCSHCNLHWRNFKFPLNNVCWFVGFWKVLDLPLMVFYLKRLSSDGLVWRGTVGLWWV